MNETMHDSQVVAKVANESRQMILGATAKALEWLQRAADQQHAQAQTALAVKYEMGQGGVKADPAKAALWYLRAANQQWVQAMRGTTDRQLLIDASALQTFDSSAIAVLLACRRQAQAQGHWCRSATFIAV